MSQTRRPWGGAVGDRTFDAVVNFVSFDADDARRKAAFFGPRARQYVHISSASIYSKPVRQVPITESTPAGPNPPLPTPPRNGRPSRRCTVPGHHRPPVAHLRRRQPAVAGGWATVERIAPRPGDPGARRRHLAVDADPRRGLRPGAGRTARQSAGGRRDLQHHRIGRLHLGPDLHDRRAALGVEARLVHVASEMFPLVAPDGSGRARWSATSGTARSSTPPRSVRSCPASRPGSPSTAPPTG